MVQNSARPKKPGATIEDMKSWSPEEFALYQAKLAEDYAKGLRQMSEAHAAAKDFQRNLEAARSRQAAPLPFGGGGPTPPQDFSVGGAPVQIGTPSPGTPVAGGGPPPGYDPNLTEAAFNDPNPATLNGVINDSLRQRYGSGLMTLGAEGTGGGGLAIAGAQRGSMTPPESQSAQPGLPIPPMQSPGSPAPAAGGGGDTSSILPFALAGISDAVKENLTLQGARGAKGTASHTLLAMDVEHRKEAQAQMKYRLDLANFMRTQQKDAATTLKTFAEGVAPIVRNLSVMSGPERDNAIIGLKGQAKSAGIPEGIVDSLAAQPDLTRLFPAIIPYLGPESMVILQNLPNEKDPVGALTTAGLPRIRRTVLSKVDEEIAAMKQEPAYQGKDIPFDVLRRRVAGNDVMLQDYMNGAIGPRDQYKTFVERLQGQGVAMPETQAALQEAGTKAGATAQATQDVTNAPANVAGAAARAGAIAEAEKPAKIEVAAATGEKAAQIGVQKALVMPVGEKATQWENAAGLQGPADKGIEWMVTHGFHPVGTKLNTEQSKRAVAALLNQVEGLIPAMEKKGFLSQGYYIWDTKTAGLKRLVAPGDPDLEAFLMHASTMVATSRALGDIGARAQAAYDSVINLIKKPTSADAMRKSIGQLKDALQAETPGRPMPSGGAALSAPPGWKIERVK